MPPLCFPPLVYTKLDITPNPPHAIQKPCIQVVLWSSIRHVAYREMIISPKKK